MNSDARSIRPVETVLDLAAGDRFYPHGNTDPAQLCEVVRAGVSRTTGAGGFVSCRYVQGAVPVLQPASLPVDRAEWWELPWPCGHADPIYRGEHGQECAVCGLERGPRFESTDK